MASPSVLLAIPDVLVRSVARKLTVAAGQAVAEAASVALAVKWLETMPIRLVVLDPAMGGAKDAELVARFVGVKPELDVVLWMREGRIAAVKADLNARHVAAWVRDIWTPPLEPARVERAVQAACAGK